MKNKSGFTLIEILISLFIMAIMITAFTKLMNSTFKGMRTVTQSSDLTSEIQLAIPIISERLQNATCIFSENTPLTFGNSPLHQNTIRNGAGSFWLPDTDPVLAMFMPGSTSGATNNYDFYAYYPILRSSYFNVDQIGPSTDVQNDSSVWMLLEYKHEVTLTSRPRCHGGEDLTGGGRSRYLADYVAPSNDVNIPYTMFIHDTPAEDAADQRQSVTVNLRFKRNNGNRVETVPSDGSLMSTTIFPRAITYW